MKLISFYPELSLESNENVDKLFEWVIDKEDLNLKRNSKILREENTQSFDKKERDYLDRIYEENLYEISSVLNK